MDQTFSEYLEEISLPLDESAVIAASCCGRKKPVFSIRPREMPTEEKKLSTDGFFCDSCVTEGVRGATYLLRTLAEAAVMSQDWSAVRYDRDRRLVATDQYDIERVREKIDPERLSRIDEYRDWLRQIPDLYDSPSEAVKELFNRPMP